MSTASSQFTVVFGKIEGREETVSMSLKTLAVYTIVLCFSTTSGSRQRVAPGSGTHKLTHLSPFNAPSATRSAPPVDKLTE